MKVRARYWIDQRKPGKYIEGGNVDGFRHGHDSEIVVDEIPELGAVVEGTPSHEIDLDSYIAAKGRIAVIGVAVIFPDPPEEP